ncbi:TetR/AcrR family transcriptional regulator [Embleya sp. NBC_00896]|uniref:TetR/AcrR family transcriptional regulator n=1 Tax=Embleya sp. NBC_00896 TaxID=2975961 RepID=UPI00386F8BA6|nr:TetR/AcrR family transcriptional regulator [Embleya sp. NBC_00896]
MTTSDTPGLREQKKRETRVAISDHATRLFIERGFEATTIADIASAARVAKMTVTNYFPRKEDLAFDHHEAFVAGLATIVTERAVGESAVAALRAAFVAGLEQRDPIIGFSGLEFTRMISESPTLVARLRDLHEHREDALAATLAAETGADPDDLEPALIAAQIGGVHRVLFRELQRRTLAGEPNDAIASALTEPARQAFALLEQSAGHYAVRTT